MDFPKLRALAVIGFACCKGRDQGSLIAIGSKAGIHCSDCSFAARLCYCRHKVLRGARVLAHKQQIKICAVIYFPTAEFSERDDG